MSGANERKRSSRTFLFIKSIVSLYSLKAEFKEASNPAPVTLSAATDTQKVFDNIKGFVDKYNETIDLMNKKVREERFRSFAPLQGNRHIIERDGVRRTCHINSVDFKISIHTSWSAT
ncbi:flagellar filament capping protein FliD [Bacillus subtilis]